MFGVYPFGEPYFGQAPSVTAEDLPAAPIGRRWILIDRDTAWTPERQTFWTLRTRDTAWLLDEDDT